MQTTMRQIPLKSDRRGAAAVEFALVLPTMLMVLAGSIEFARANQVRNAAAFSAYEGCRRAIIPGGTATAATASAQKVLDSNFIGSGTITVTPSTITDTTKTVTVSVAINLESVGWITPKFTQTKSITRSCTLTREKTAGN